MAAATASASAGKRRGRPESVEETKRRTAVLERVLAGELTNADAAAELGISYAAWSAWKSNHGKRNGVIVAAPSERAFVAPSPVPTAKRGRGRRSEPVKTARRAEVLQRVQAGELSNVEAATELGITPGAWAGWKAYHQKRHDVIVPAPRNVGTRAKVIVPAPTIRAARTPDVSDLVARIERVQRFRQELHRRVRELIAFVEERFPR